MVVGARTQAFTSQDARMELFHVLGGDIEVKPFETQA